MVPILPLIGARKILGSSCCSKIKRFLIQRHGDLLDEFQELAAMESL